MDSLPDDIVTLRAELAIARAKAADDAATIARQNLEIAKLKRQIYGPHSERSARLIDQLELELEELEAAATEDELAAEQAAAKTTTVAAFTRLRPARQPFPAHLPRERVVAPAPTVCACCGSDRLRKLGETDTETLEVIPRQWRVIQHVLEKMTCRDCEKISEPPAPFHVTPRGWSGPNLLAMLLFEKFGQHQPLNRQAERYAREGVPLSLSTLADQVGAGCVVLEPLLRRIDALFEIERGINSRSADERKSVRQEMSAPLVGDLEAWMRDERAKLSRGSDIAKAMDYMLKRWPSFTRFLDDGRVCLSNNAAERGLRGIALGRKSWLFAGPDRGGQRAAAMYSLIVTAKMCDVDPQARLADVLARIAGHPANKLDELLPWNWRPEGVLVDQAA